MGAFGRVAGQIANDWASQRQQNQQTSEELANNQAQRGEIAQRIKSQMLSDQLAQAAQSATERNDSLKNQVLQQNLKTAGWDTDRGQYEQDDHGNWLFTIRNPYTKETRSFPSGKPSAVVEKEDTDAAAMARRQQQDADTAARQKETELTKQLAAKTKFNNDMALLRVREQGMDARERLLVSRRTPGLSPQQKLQLIGPVNELQRIKSEIESIDKQLFTGKNPAPGGGMLNMFTNTKEMTEDQRATLVDQRKQLVDQRGQVITQIEMIGALSDPQPPGANAAPGGPANGGPPPLPPGAQLEGH